MNRTNRINSMPPLGQPFGTMLHNPHSGFNNGSPNQIQHIIDLLLQGVQNNNLNAQGASWSPLLGGVQPSSSVSHMSQDQYEEQTFVS